jgi:hypothetical protein
MSEEPVERLMDIILQMKFNLAHVNETIHQQTFEIRQQLDAIFEEEKIALERCLGNIDVKVRECAAYAADYHRLHQKLSLMRAKLVQLGAEPGTLPAPPPAEEVEEMIAWRLRELKEKGSL